jgi:apolipoprotein N-acyltransferase
VAFSPAVGAAVAAVLAGWLYTLTVRLRPVAVAPWLAPLPLLLLAPRVPGVIVGVAAGIAWGSGQLVLWRYWTRVLSMPAPLAVAQIVGGSSGVAAIMLLARTQLVAGRLVFAAVTVPVAWVALEFLVSVRSVHGAWWSVAYTQGDLPVVLQIASVTGSSGLGALLSFPAAVIAAVVAPVGSAVERVTVGAVSATGLAALAMWAVRRAKRYDGYVGACRPRSRTGQRGPGRLAGWAAGARVVPRTRSAARPPRRDSGGATGGDLHRRG